MHVKNGQKLRNEGKLPEALAEFEKAYAADPASDIAMQEIRRTREMIRRNSGAPDSPGADNREEEKTLTPSELAHRRAQERTDALLPVPELKPMNPEPFDLRMSNQPPRVLFETVAGLAKINVLFDPEYNQQQTIRAGSIELTRTTLDQALDQISVITKSFWKPLSANTIFVTVDNPTKRREYAEQVVKVFYLSNVTAPQEMQEMLTVLRTVVDVQKVFSFTSQNALIVRAEADTMALVEKLIADLDKARPEVIIDVMVMEVNTTHMRNHHGSFRADRHHDERDFRAAPGDYDAGHPDRHGRDRHHHHDHGNNRDHHDADHDGHDRHTHQHQYSAERAGPHLERGFLADQPAGSRARSGAQRFEHARAAGTADSRGG